MIQYSSTHPSRIFKFCPQCGHHNFLFDGKKKFVCASCNFNYYINASAAVAVIIELPDNNIILTRRKHDPRAGTFDLPGGFVDTNERVENAVKREIKEELNLEIDEMHFLGSFPNEYNFKGISYFTCDLAFICCLEDASMLIAADDVSEAIIIDIADIDYNNISFPSIVNILKAYVEGNCNFEKNLKY